MNLLYTLNSDVNLISSIILIVDVKLTCIYRLNVLYIDVFIVHFNAFKKYYENIILRQRTQDRKIFGTCNYNYILL